MGELLYDDDQESFEGGNNGENSYDDHNQLGVLRESSSNQVNSNGQSGQSSYARVSLMELFLCFIITLWLRLNYYTQKIGSHTRWQWISHKKKFGGQDR